MTNHCHPGAALAVPVSRANSEPQRSFTLKPGLVLAVAATAAIATGLVACSTYNSNTGGSSTTATSSTTAPTGSSGDTSSATATAAANFVGDWTVHGSKLTVTPTTAALSTSMGPCGSPGSRRFCAETDTMGVMSGDDKQLTLRVIGVTFTDQTGASVPNPDPGPSTAVGDTMQLAWQAPGLLKTTAVHGFPGFAGGNSHWCGAGVSQANRPLCGA